MDSGDGAGVASLRRADGGVDEVEYVVTPDGEQLFTCLHRPPPGAVSGALLICSPILTDFGANYQREVRLARRLAAAGTAVGRYHPRGLGHSDGDTAAVTLDSLVEDGLVALRWLRGRTGIATPTMLGTRFAALVALTVADADAPVVLWEPVVSPPTYLKEARRARAVHRLGDDRREAPDDELARRGFVDVLGIPVGRELLATPADRGLVALAPPPGSPVLVVSMADRTDLRPDLAQVVERWRADGADLTLSLCPTDESWWFLHDRLATADAVLDTTVEWLRGR